MNLAVGRLRPDETAMLESLGEQAQSIPAGPQQLNDVATPSTECKDMGTKWIVLQSALHFSCQAVEATAHVREASRDSDVCARRQPDHVRRL